MLAWTSLTSADERGRVSSIPSTSAAKQGPIWRVVTGIGGSLLGNRLSPAAHTGGWLGTAESSERDAPSSPGYHRDLARRERWGSSHACSRRSTTAFRGTRRIPTDRARGREF